ncbi:AAA family ATPase [Rhizomicrobium electricum]|jgi:MoxR-like ATPase|uniref:MoxR family ATPase n=1 Tax=Rhizomicrobium electricum TaxID=480070 RepID=A0ABN1EDI8_9PROT|nr:MoxR family ATPase [Rhizomicrobium electricum]NIJ48732.1 MoxR-like ATPase [Rhizomicrobium electricum]
MSVVEMKKLADAIRAEVAKAVVGQERAVDLLLTALFTGGHILLEGPPGTAKTLLAQSFAASLNLKFGRIQFTPDLLPGDILGSNQFNFQTSSFTLTRGPIFCELLLADEINRTPPKTQAALLEAMQERRVTLDGAVHPLGDRFMVIATENPIEQQGTYPLPEAQLDRFLLKHTIDYPSEAEEKAIVKGGSARMPTPQAAGVVAVADGAAIAEGMATVAAVRLTDPIVDYIVGIVRATRSSADISYGASPRSAAMLAAAARARAALEGREYVIPDDVKGLCPPVLRHRVVLSPAAEIDGRSTDAVLETIVSSIEAPR